MHTLKVLFGGSDKRTNNLIEVAARDVCYGHAVIECIPAAMLHEVAERSSREPLALVVITLDYLGNARRRARSTTAADAMEVIRGIKARYLTPVIVLTGSEQDEIPLLEAGADHVFGLFFNQEVLKCELRRLLGVPEYVEQAEPEPSRFSLSNLFARGLQRWRHA